MKHLVLFFLVFQVCAGYGQSTNAPLNEDYYHWIDRYEIKSGRVVPQVFTSVKPYKRKAIAAFVDSVQLRDNVFSSSVDLYNYQYLRNDNWEWSRSEDNESKKPVLKHLYKKKSDFLFTDLPEFDIHVNPVLYTSFGHDGQAGESLYLNSRGVEIRGMVDRKIGFYTFLTDNQARLPLYVRDGIAQNPVVPHEGFWKDFKDNGVDYFQARAYIDFDISKHIYMQFGNDKTFIGNGYRSLIFSDYAPPTLFLRTNVKVWKLNYLFQLNRVAADAPGSIGGSGAGKRRYPEKFMAFHHASINIGKRFNLGFFESVVFSPKDSLNNNTFDLSYLNPVIFYRAIEQQFGSSDNVILGMDFKWMVAKRLSAYGQVVFDEFLLDRLKEGNGWWANKFALQGGLKYIDVLGVNNLDAQLEANVVRPYTYSHNTQYGSYTNYRQPFAHPLGANFKELIGIVRYQPIPKLNVIAKAIYSEIGRDTTGVNWGSDLLKSNATREQEFGNTIGQGLLTKVTYLDLTASYMLKHNLFIDMKLIRRDSAIPQISGTNNTTITSLALRWNIGQRLYDF
ncbi:MAG TPA: hypothetical protein PKN99_13135 [Cyclobacteriaceae bacterium]|nr:hypothetical protein [Cyclobacteriaceae bacterium]